MQMNYQYAFILVFLMAICLPPFAIADTYIVTNTNDSAPGSLRQALLDANTNVGADTIIFNIPTSDPNYNAALGVWTISPLSGLPNLSDDSTTIDGTTQSIFIGGDPNPNGPEIELDGTNAGDVDGFSIFSSNNIIKDLVINRFKNFGIQITFDKAHHNVVSGCYVGIDVTGTMRSGNGFSGIIIYYGAKKNVIGGKTTTDRNVISGNNWSGVEIQAWDADSNIVIGNYIGTDATGSKDLGNLEYGVNVWSGAQGNIIGGATSGERNVISANDRNGVNIVGPTTDHNVIIGNYIGTNADGTLPLPNYYHGINVGSRTKHTTIGGTAVGQGNLISCNEDCGIAITRSIDNIISGNFIGTDSTGGMILGNKKCGISLSWGSHNNIVGPDNVIAYNGSDGIRVEHDTTVANTITQNFIFDNDGLGIENIDGGNTELQPPIVTTVTTTSVTGTTLPNSTVEIFSDGEDEGGIFEKQVLSDAAGNFSWIGTPTGPHVTATVTDAAGNTSEFSHPYLTEVADVKLKNTSTKFALHQNYPNPFNPQTQMNYELPEVAKVEFIIFNISGQKIRTLVDHFQPAGCHSVCWNGIDNQGRKVTSGIYIYQIQAGNFIKSRKLIITK